ncbi:hypothetical protein QBC46DRAFT_58157 [Diplogelasinospora grovesii]|uniref:Zn(2)-C6 fungal-type domain-containing protein n=1 Tax=Diplogelasinospora grovesii TaxID=303347 RepID=A0AAN6ND99_9PEZI|nr:hypothetical protein QBC46DRAFT_58157 [Diplogelasinospora grovesii]
MGDSLPAPLESHRERLRRRPALSCEHCRLRKVRCDRDSPCGNCARINISCTYAARSAPPGQQTGGPSRRLPLQPIATPPTPTAPTEEAATQPLSGAPRMACSCASRCNCKRVTTGISVLRIANLIEADDGARSGTRSEWRPQTLRPIAPAASPATAAETLVERMQRLERQLAAARGTPGRGPDVAMEMPPPIEAHEDWSAGASRPPVGRPGGSRTRLSSPGSWVDGTNVFPALADVLHHSRLIHARFEKCKSLIHAVTSQRVPPSLPAGMGEIGNQLPPRSVANELVDNYFRTWESVYRVLHINTFQMQYEQHWRSTHSSNNKSFVVLMQLVMAVGACFSDASRYDSTMRSMATRWVYEADFWLAAPSGNARSMIMQNLQIMCLSLLARQTVGVGGRPIWASSGALLQTAMCMGLHRDPGHLVRNPDARETGAPWAITSGLQIEMRRRLWWTILEMALQASVDVGGPLLLSMRDFDTLPPAHVDDNDLTNDSSPIVVTEQSGVFTQMSVPLALQRSFATRLEIARAVSGLRSGDIAYDEVLRLSSELTAECHVLRQRLASLLRDNGGSGASRGGGVSDFQLRIVEMLTHRFFFALHMPLLTMSSRRNPRHPFSRKTCLDTALKVCGLAARPHSWGNKDFSSLMDAGYGSHRKILLQGTIMIALELIARYEDGTATGEGDAELRTHLEAGLARRVRQIRAGGANIEGYVFDKAVLVQIDALDAAYDGDRFRYYICRDMLAGIEEGYQMMKEYASSIPGLSLPVDVDDGGQGQGQGRARDDDYPLDNDDLVSELLSLPRRTS